MKDLSSETCLGTGQFCTTLVFSGSTAMPASETKWPAKETCDWKNIPFSGFSFRLASVRRLKNSSKFLKCILNIWPKSMISSTCIKRETNVMPENTLFMTRSKHAGLVILPKGTTLNCHSPLSGMQKAVKGRLSLS